MKSNAASLADINDLAARTKPELGGLDALFICVVKSRFEPFEETTEDNFDELFSINAKGPYFTIQKLAPLISDGGAVVVACPCSARTRPSRRQYDR